MTAWLLLSLAFFASPPKGIVRERPVPGRPARGPEQPVQLVNIHTREVLVLPSPRDVPVPGDVLSRFLRCHFTGRERVMDPRILVLFGEIANRFGIREIQIYSAYRSPRYNMLLRKRLGEVSPNSYHTKGQAADIVVPGVDLAQLAAFLRKLRRGGVGYYSGSEFVHMDTGPVRFWEGN